MTDAAPQPDPQTQPRTEPQNAEQAAPAAPKPSFARLKIVTWICVGMTLVFMGLMWSQDEPLLEIVAGGIGFGFGIFLSLYFLILVFVTTRNSLRFGVRSAVVLSRTAGIGDLHREVHILAGEQRVPTTIELSFVPKGGWGAAVTRVIVRPLLMLIWLLSAMVAFVTLCGFIGALFNGDGLEIASSIYGPFFVVGGLIAYGIMKRMTAMGDPPHLAGVVIAAMHGVIKGEPADCRVEHPSCGIDFGNGALVHFEADEDLLTTLRLRVPIWPTKVQITRINRKNLAAEADDIDLGDDLFDRFTIMSAVNGAETVNEAWLTVEVRAVLLLLLAEGAEVEDGDLIMKIGLLSGLDRVLRSVPLLATLSGLVMPIRAQSEKDRVFAALDAGTDIERAHLLDAVAALADAEVRKDIRSAWAADGEGATRLDAATVLPDDLATNFLEIIAQDEDAAADHRGQAYGRLAYRTSAGCGITRRALQDLAERDRPADVDLILAIGHHISAQLADDRDPPPELIPDALALTGVSGAALAYVLACAYLGGALERSDRIRKAALDPINSLPGDTPTALPRWAAYAKVLDAFYAAAKPRTAPAPTVSVPSTDELRVALMSVDRITRDLAANSEGGLSVAEPKDTGGLTLLRSPPPEAD